MNIEDLLNDTDVSGERERLLALLLEEEGFDLTPSIVITPRDGSGAPPLSFAQQRLWFLNQLDPHSPFYNIPAAVRLSGALDADALGRTLNEIVRRHEALRTTFRSVGGLPVQVIAPELELPLPVVTLRETSDEGQEREVFELASAEARRPFDLTHAPLLRPTLLRLDADEHVLLLTIHHIVSDGWSLGVLIRELVVLYGAFSAGQPSPLAPLPIQYADFAVWQRDWLQGEVRQKQLDFWKQLLSGQLPTLNLPLDRPRPPVQSFRGANQTLTLPKELSEALQTLCREEGATLFMALLAAFVLLLHRHTGEDDIIIGTPTANRTQSETEGLIGFFANTLMLRTRVVGRESFRQLLKRVRETTTGAFDHQDLPLEQLVQELQPERDLSRSPLFQVMLALQNAPAGEMKLSGLTISPLEVDSATAMFDLLFSLGETADGLVGKLVYSTDLFDAATITRLLEHFRQLLEIVVRRPGAPLAELIAVIPPQTLSVVVTSTFTAQPLKEPLDFWSEELNLPMRVRFAPYGQVFQQLLDPEGLLAGNAEGYNLILLRLEDWDAGAREEEQHGASGGWEQNVLDFLDALESYARQHPTPTIVCLCPPSEAAAAQADKADLIRRLEEVIAARLIRLKEVSVLRHEEVSGLYAVRQVNDARADELGHLPYTAEFFTALGTAIARRVFSRGLSSYRVIALDCDETLWGGVCGEDEPTELHTGYPYQSLQELLARQQSQGKLLCLCSKNIEADVDAVFEAHPEMPLDPKRFASSRIGWDSTAEKLNSLADELGVSLEHFVYVSRNPVECAEVRVLCPEVLMLQLPPEPSEIPLFLNHVWAFEPETGDPLLVSQPGARTG